MSANPKVGDQWLLARVDTTVLVKPTFTSALDTTLHEWVDDNRDELLRWFRDTSRWTYQLGPAEYECNFEDFCLLQYEGQLDRDEAADPFDGEIDYDDDSDEEEDEWFI